jgi:DNA-binding response OmpR family regulator
MFASNASCSLDFEHIDQLGAHRKNKVTYAEKVLIVDDDLELSEMLTSYLQREAFDIATAADLATGWDAISRTRPDLLVLDLMLPDGNGLDLCRRIRKDDAALPILILTARGDPLDHVLGLELGADDYLSKPFEPRELVARVRALLRRASVQRDRTSETTKISFDQFVFDLAARTLRAGSNEIALTTIELKMLQALSQTPNQAVSRDALAAAVQPGAYRPLARAVDVQITRLRKKLRDAAHGREVIQTIRGEGYALMVSGTSHC